MTRYRLPSGSNAHTQFSPPVADSPWSSMTTGAPGGPATSRMNVVPRPGSSSARPGGTNDGACASGVEANDLDLQDEVFACWRLEVDDLADPMSQQRSPEGRAGRDHFEIVVPFLD